ncbi:leucine-rich repeat protein [bacterium]|nr:leucine-rich repeat protein [bacterium]
MNEEAVRKALRECVERLGTGILADKAKFRGVMHDMLPGLGYQSERSLLIMAADSFSIGEKLLKAQAEERERVYTYLVKEMTDGGLQHEAAETVLRSFALALGWKVESVGAGANVLQPSSGSGSCAHRNIDFSACRCRDCGNILYGIFEDDRYTPYEAMRKKERDGVLISISDSYGGTFVIPEHITALDDDCLSEHADLQEVILSSSLRSIGCYAFENCSSLKKLKVPASVGVIGRDAFKGLKRVYYDGPASGSPWGAGEHVVSAKPKPNWPPAPKPQPAPKPVPQPVPQPNSLASLRAVYANKRVGERFEFGRYPQGANGEVKPISWRVLRRDKDALLVISEYGLDAKPYNGECKNITWSECTLRRWLNGEFMQKAFSAQEQSLIKVSTLSNNAGLSTDDRVFLLSKDEAMSLFADDNDRMAKSTTYATKRGAYTYTGDGTTWWWLRSRSNDDYDAADVHAGGYIGLYDVNNASAAVRPAFRIAI